MSRRFRFALAAIVVTGGSIRLARLGHFSYWLDEILQAYRIHGDWTFFWKSLRFDACHPPLDYLVGKLVETLHPSDAARKLPAVLWGAGTIGALGVLLARRAGEIAGLTAAALVALAPYHVRFSQELRPYSLALFLLCLALLALDRFLAKPGATRLAALFFACLATAYTLYTAAIVLAIAAAAMLAEDAFAPDPDRRRAARRFLAWSPVFSLALWLAYLPWWPVLLTALRRPPMAPTLPLSLDRAGRVLAFFAFAPDDGPPLSAGGWLLLALAAGGAWIAAARRGLGFLVVWGMGGLALIEALARLHPQFDVARRFLPAGPGVTALAAVCLAVLLERPVTRLAGVAVLAAVLVFDARSLRIYFREGRPDWRPLAEYLRREAAPAERVLTENQHAQLCVAFYLVGPSWLSDALEGRDPGRSVVSVDGETNRLVYAWRPGTRAWLVLGAGPGRPALARWAASFPAREFQVARGVTVYRLDPVAASPGR